MEIIIMNRKLFSTITCLVATLGFIFGASEYKIFGKTKINEPKAYEHFLNGDTKFDFEGDKFFEFRNKETRFEFRDTYFNKSKFSKDKGVEFRADHVDKFKFRSDDGFEFRDNNQFKFKDKKNKADFLVDKIDLNFKDVEVNFGFLSGDMKVKFRNANDESGFLSDRKEFKFKDNTDKSIGFRNNSDAFDFRNKDIKILVGDGRFKFKDKAEKQFKFGKNFNPEFRKDFGKFKFSDTSENFDFQKNEIEFSFLKSHDGFDFNHKEFKFKENFAKDGFKDSQEFFFNSDINKVGVRNFNKTDKFQNQINYTLSIKTNKAKIRTETIKNIMWQWENNPISILNAMQAWSENKDTALEKLKEGQTNNKKVQQLYDDAAEQLPDFWDLVFYTTWSEADFSTFESNLAWQHQNDSNSLEESEKAWQTNPRQEIWAYYHLLWGQRKNPNALKIYRACWKEDKNKVMSSVSKILKR